MPLDIGAQDFAQADLRLRGIRRAKAIRELDSEIEAFGQEQREKYERCAATEEKIGDAVRIMVDLGPYFVRMADDLKEQFKGIGLDVYDPPSTQTLAHLLAETLDFGILKTRTNIIARSIDREFV